MCPDCTAAHAAAWHGFRQTCRGCWARSVARSPIHHQAKVEKRQTPEYRALLTQFGLTHQEVLDEFGRDALTSRAVTS